MKKLFFILKGGKEMAIVDTPIRLELKDNLISGQTYFLVIKTASGRGCRINKSVRTLVHDIPITVV